MNHKRVYIYPYKGYSKSADNLSEILGVPRIKHLRSRFKGHVSKIVINWGASNLSEEASKCKVLNKPEQVRKAINKLDFFKTISELPTDQQPRLVPWTTDKDQVKRWIRDGYEVFARKILTGHSGNGIIHITSETDPIPDATLYTQYIKKDKEFRVHVLDGKIIDVQRKIRDPNREPTNWKIRSHDNGFIYVRNGVEPPQDAKDQALLAVSGIGLLFGAVDVVALKNGKSYVLEVNTSPGLEGETLASYSKAFGEVIQNV